MDPALAAEGQPAMSESAADINAPIQKSNSIDAPIEHSTAQTASSSNVRPVKKGIRKRPRSESGTKQTHDRNDTRQASAGQFSAHTHRKPDMVQMGAESSASDDKERPSIAEIREEQKLRSKTKGVDAAALVTASLPKVVQTAVQQDREEAYGLQRSSGVEAFSSAEADSAHMRAYVEAKVRERATKAARRSESETAGEAARREPGQIPESHELWKDDKWLYELPEYLRPVAPREKSDIAEGGVILGGTGMMEVALPEEFKLRNIQDTKRATEMMRQKASEKDTRVVSQFATGSFTANYSLHDKESSRR